ncbi:DUF5703 family protein [Zhihengliuella sp.]|uniref:DUF5703 family protein n=1 Tax=Zhihengliuella sp. TaxID=1954483 RepID=UPI0028115D71|nr:DUF5703 family protein [Zhihengliuella sp.]
MKQPPQPPTPLPRAERVRDPHEPYEYLIVTVQPGQSLAEARRAIVEHAEYGKWELKRTSKYRGGVHKYWLRRRITRVERTLTVY